MVSSLFLAAFTNSTTVILYIYYTKKNIRLNGGHLTWMWFNGNNMLVTFSLNITIHTNPSITRIEIQFNITDPIVLSTKQSLFSR